MILAEVRDYVRTRGQASLSDIALHFGADPDAVRGMLEVWVRKGTLHKGMAAASCGTSCLQCDQAAVELYYWTREPVAPPGSIPGGCPDA